MRPVIKVILSYLLASKLLWKELKVTRNCINIWPSTQPLTSYLLWNTSVSFANLSTFQAVLIAEDEKLELSALSDVQNFVEIKNGCFGWQPQPNSEKNSKKGGF